MVFLRRLKNGSAHGPLLASGSATLPIHSSLFPFLSLRPHPLPSLHPSSQSPSLDSCHCSGDGSLLASGSADETVQLWDVTAAAKQTKAETKYALNAVCIALS